MNLYPRYHNARPGAEFNIRPLQGELTFPSAPYNMPPQVMFAPRGQLFRPRGFIMSQRPRFNNNLTYQNYSIDSNNTEHWCDTCDRGFRTNALLSAHQAEHQTCGIEGCRYVAHPNVIAKHIQMQHSSGLYSKIRSCNTPEDIEKWIKERKSKYPSRENVELQRQKNIERLARGESLTCGSNRGRGYGRGRGHRGFGRGRGFNHHRGSNFANRRFHRSNRKPREYNSLRRKVYQVVVESVDKEDWNGTLPPFPGTAAILGLIDSDLESSSEYESDDLKEMFDDEEWKLEDTAEVEPITINNALGSLIALYGSSDESETDANPIESKTEERKKSDAIKESHIHTQTNKARTVEENNESDEAPEEQPIKKVTNDELVDNIITTDLNQNVPNETATDSPRNRHRKRPSNSKLENVKRQEPKRYKRYQPTLLEKLLKNEIRHERNMLLQCVRHVVRQSFFGIGQKKSISDVEEKLLSSESPNVCSVEDNVLANKAEETNETEKV